MSQTLVMTPPTPSRRSPGQLGQDVLVAAVKVFSAKGFDGATIRDIATEAGVQIPMVYRHAASKAELFEQAVVGPLKQLVDECLAEGLKPAERGLTPGERSRLFIGLFYDLCREHRGLITAALAAEELTEGGIAGITGGPSPFPEIFDKLAPATALYQHGGDAGDPKMLVRFMFGVVFSTVALDHVYFPPDQPAPSRERVIDELVSFLSQL